MKASVFMFLLVNNNATKDFTVGTCLRQGDSQSLFLFVLVIEAIRRLMKKAVELKEFKGFQVNEKVTFDILQFVEETLILGESSWSNLWSLKAILIGFKLVSSLRVNFYKSNICEENAKINFLHEACIFLFCSISKLPFNFLGVQVGESPRRSCMWK